MDGKEMKVAMTIVELPAVESNQTVTSAELRIRRPGIIRHTTVMAKPDNLSVIMQATGRKPRVELVPVMICEVDPDSTEDKLRKFLIVPPEHTLESYQLNYRGHFTYPQGVIMFLFEETI